MTLWIWRLLFISRYEVNLLLGRTCHGSAIVFEESHCRLYRRLVHAFETYDPGERDYLRNLYLRWQMIPPPANELRAHAAKWATDALVLLERIHAGQLPPDALMPLIAPDELLYYQERVQTYCQWLFSGNSETRRLPVPFFYALAAERLSHLLKQPGSHAAIPQGTLTPLPLLFSEQRAVPQEVVFGVLGQIVLQEAGRQEALKQPEHVA